MAEENSKTAELYGTPLTVDNHYGKCGRYLYPGSAGTTSSSQGTKYNYGDENTGKGTEDDTRIRVETTTVYSSGQVNIGGTWKEIKSVHTNIGGAWKNVSIDTGSKTEVTYE